MTQDKHEKKQEHRRLPITKGEDIEFSSELADGEDLEARVRAKNADRRQHNRRK